MVKFTCADVLGSDWLTSLVEFFVIGQIKIYNFAFGFGFGFQTALLLSLQENLKAEKERSEQSLAALQAERERELEALREERQKETEGFQSQITALQEEMEDKKQEMNKLHQELKDKEVENRIAGKKGDQLVGSHFVASFINPFKFK